MISIYKTKRERVTTHQTQSIFTTVTRHALSAWRIHDKGPKTKLLMATITGRNISTATNTGQSTYKPTLWEEGGALLVARPP